MKNIPEDILDTVLLEEYALGITDYEDTVRVELLLNQYPALKLKLKEIESSIENYSSIYGVQKDSIDNDTKDLKKNKGSINYALPVWPLVAASILILMSFISLNLLNENRELKQLNESLFTSLQKLEHDNQEQSSQLVQYEKLAIPTSKKLQLYANHWDTPLNSVAYWNSADRTSYIAIHSMPKFESECFQIWADVNGEMIDLGVLTKVGKDFLLPLIYMDSATSLNITIEPLGGSEHPTVEKLVSTVSI